MIAELRFIKSSVKTETIRVTEVVKVMIMILTSEEWLFEIVVILSLADVALAAAMI